MSGNKTKKDYYQYVDEQLSYKYSASSGSPGTTSSQHEVGMKLGLHCVIASKKKKKKKKFPGA